MERGAGTLSAHDAGADDEDDPVGAIPELLLAVGEEHRARA